MLGGSDSKPSWSQCVKPRGRDISCTAIVWGVTWQTGLDVAVFGRGDRSVEQRRSTNLYNWACLRKFDHELGFK